MRRIVLNRQDFSELSGHILYQGAYLFFEAHGSSMSPFIRDSDFLTVQPVEPSTLKLGDVAFYWIDGGQLIAHRVVGKRAQHGQLVLQIRGNASFCQDEMVPASQILGRVTRIQRGEKIIRLERWRWQLISILWAKFPALCFMPYRLMRKAKKIALDCLNRFQTMASVESPNRMQR